MSTIIGLTNILCVVSCSKSPIVYKNWDGTNWDGYENGHLVLEKYDGDEVQIKSSSHYVAKDLVIPSEVIDSEGKVCKITKIGIDAFEEGGGELVGWLEESHFLIL